MSFQWAKDGARSSCHSPNMRLKERENCAKLMFWQCTSGICKVTWLSRALKQKFHARSLLIAMLSLHLIPAHSISQDVIGNLASSQARQVRKCNSRGMFAVCDRMFPCQRLWFTNTLSNDDSCKMRDASLLHVQNAGFYLYLFEYSWWAK